MLIRTLLIVFDIRGGIISSGRICFSRVQELWGKSQWADMDGELGKFSKYGRLIMIMSESALADGTKDR